MSSVIVNEKGELYGGFDPKTNKPVWFKTMRDGCKINDDKMAEAAVRQLKALGFEQVVQRDANGVLRKWVPAELDASAINASR